jgi:hypothetical protein
MSARSLAQSGRTFPDHQLSELPHTPGGGAQQVDYTGTAVDMLDCTALAGRYVRIRAEVASDGEDSAGYYRYTWITAAEAAGSPAFSTANAAASTAPAEGAKIGGKFGKALAPTEVVDSARPVLLYQPYSEVTTAEAVRVSLADPNSNS